MWLSGEVDLDFQFEAREYKQLAQHTDEFAAAQATYITQLFKIVEELQDKNITQQADDLDDDEPLGVVSRARDMGSNKRKVYKEQLVNIAFAQMHESLQRFVNDVSLQIADEQALQYEELLSLMDCLAGTCFVLDGSRKPEKILEWINKYDPKPDNDFIDAVMYETPLPYKHLQFWTSYMGTLLSRGMFDKAEAALKASKYEELAESCPDLHTIIEGFVVLVGNYNAQVAEGEFPEWKKVVCEFRDTYHLMKGDILDLGHVAIAAQIHDLLCLLSGLVKTTASFVSTWYDMYGSLALFQVRDDDSVYADYYKLAIAEKGSNVASGLEQAFRHVVSGKFLQAILAIDSYDPSTAAYVSKLFELKGFFSEYYFDLADGKVDAAFSRRYVSDYLLTRHAFECFEVHDLVPVGMGLLMKPVISASKETEDRASATISQFLPHYQCFTNDDLEWALTICAKLDLPAVVNQLYLKQGERSLKEGHLYEAMNMLVNCYDETNLSSESAAAMAKIHHIVWDLLFQDSLLNGLPVPDELLINIVTNQVDPDFHIHPVIRQCISPYAVLTEFFIQASEPKKFAKRLLNLFHLLRFTYMPKKFMPLLLAQFIPFLYKDEFEMPQLIIMIDLIDALELQAPHPEETEELYSYAVENTPQEVLHDWRVELKTHGEEIPDTLKKLLRVLREKITAKIGDVYVKE